MPQTKKKRHHKTQKSSNCQHKTESKCEVQPRLTEMSTAKESPCHGQLQISDTGILHKDGQAKNVGHGQVTNTEVFSQECFLPDSPPLIHQEFSAFNEKFLEAIRSDNVDDALAMLTETKDKNGHLPTCDLDEALLSTCKQGHLFLVQELVRMGANIHAKDQHGSTPLLLCAERGYMELVRFLLDNGALVNMANSDGNTALILSVRSSGSLNMIKLLCEEKDINLHHQNHHGYTALMKATEVRDVDAMKYLLDQMKQKSSYGRKAVLYYHSNKQATSHTFSYVQNKKRENIGDIAKRVGLGNIFWLLTNENRTRETPLMRAALSSDVRSTIILLDAQFSDVRTNGDRQKFFGKLLDAHKKDTEFSNKDIEIIEILLKRGVKVNNKSYYDSSVIIATEAGSYKLLDLFCQYGADVNTGGYRNALVIAAEKGRSDLIELLLEYGANINRKDWRSDYEGSALDAALKKGHIECGKLLLERGAHMDFKEALNSAVRHQQPLYVKFLFEKYPKSFGCLGKKDIDNYFLSNLLESAVTGGNLEIINLLLDAGVAVNFVLRSGESLLMVAEKSEVAQLLIQRGADVNFGVASQRSSSPTALLKALSSYYRNYETRDKSELIKVLVENGAKVNFSDWEGKTPLMLAVIRDGDLTKMLLEHGADVTARNKRCQTALMLAVERNCPDSVKVLLEAIKEHPNVINYQSDDGETALILAATNCYHEIIDLLIEYGADLNISNTYGDTALLKALEYNFNMKVLKRLLEARADINHQNKKGVSALMMIMNYNSGNRVDAAEILLNAGADVNAVSNKKSTALSLLFENLSFTDERLKLAELLLQRGAKSSSLQPDILHRLILEEYLQIVPLLISNGLGPADVLASQLEKHVRGLRHDEDLFRVSVVLSPFCVALLKGFHTLARYFAENWFLTSFDISTLIRTDTIRKYLEEQENPLCVKYYEELLSQPLPLFKLAFIAVSSAVGSGLGREERINQLTIPSLIKDRLLFRKEIIHFQMPEKSEKRAVVSTGLSTDFLYAMLLQREIQHGFYVDDYYYTNDLSDSYDSDY